jgi:thiol:disulfide interchange protein DsbC
MTRGAEPPKLDCAHPADRNIALAEKLGINGTPTLIAADGRKLPGAAPATRIEAWLSQTPVAQVTTK